MSGVAIDEEVVDTFNKLKLNKTDYKYLLLGLDESMKSVKILKKGIKEQDGYEAFKEDLKEAQSKGQCRWAVYDFAYKKLDDSKNSKLVYYMWAPEEATVKQKMVYSATNSAVVKALGTGLGLQKQCHDWDDVDEIEIEKELAKK